MVDQLKKEDRMVFAAGQAENGLSLLIMGITKKSFHFLMRGDNYQSFDFTRQGIPLYMLAIAGETREHIIDRMSVYMPGPKVADMHSDNKIPQSEQAIPNMRTRARNFETFGHITGLNFKPLAHMSDRELDRLFKAILGVTDD